MILYSNAIPTLLRKLVLLCVSGGLAACMANAKTTATAVPPSAIPALTSEMAPPEAEPSVEAGVTRSPEPKGLTRKVRPKSMPSEPYPRKYYPPAAWAEGREGTVGFLLHVGADGRPRACHITSSSGHADLDAAVCPVLMKRARFDPAMENGKPISATYSNRVRWAIPKD